MDRTLLEALKSWIDARIDEKLADAAGRDSINETIRARAFEQELDALVTESR